MLYFGQRMFIGRKDDIIEGSGDKSKPGSLQRLKQPSSTTPVIIYSYDLESSSTTATAQSNHSTSAVQPLSEWSENIVRAR